MSGLSDVNANFLTLSFSESPISEEISLTTNRYQDFSKNLNDRIDNLKLTKDYMQLMDDGRDLLTWENETDVKLDQSKPTSSDPDTLAREISAFKVCFLVFFLYL